MIIRWLSAVTADLLKITIIWSCVDDMFFWHCWSSSKDHQLIVWWQSSNIQAIIWWSSNVFADLLFLIIILTCVANLLMSWHSSDDHMLSFLNFYPKSSFDHMLIICQYCNNHHMIICCFCWSSSHDYQMTMYWWSVIVLVIIPWPSGVKAYLQTLII